MEELIVRYLMWWGMDRVNENGEYLMDICMKHIFSA